MKQKQFEDAHAAMWTQIAVILDGSDPDARPLPALYRRLCQCLALAHQRGYSPAVTDYLQALVGQCHRRLYGASVQRPNTLLRWLAVDLPCRVRAEWRLLLCACLAFFGVAAVVALLVWHEPHRAYSFASPMELDKYRAMYDPAQRGHGRGGDEGDLEMFGFYIWNNVSIGFRTFAAGIFGGLPALFSLAFNGMHFGLIATWLSTHPATVQPFWSFVITHSSFELAGLVLSGMAGMRMGLALIRPGRLRRGHALQVASGEMFPVIVGAALLTLLAAFVEGFWSAAEAIPPTVKYVVGTICWALVIGFFVFAGRGAGERA